MKFVLDASVAVAWELNEPLSAKALQLRDDFSKGVHELLAPDILPIECGHALTRAERRGVIRQGDAEGLLLRILLQQVELREHLQLLTRAVELSSQHRVGVYDAHYIVLAEEEGCRVVTNDKKLLAAFPGSTIDLSKV